jgi:hypothetical protein
MLKCQRPVGLYQDKIRPVSNKEKDNIMKQTLPALIGLLFISASPSMAEEPHREHGAHVHGIGQLNVVQDGGTLLIELISPAANIVGFEHAPKTAEQQAALSKGIQTLEAGNELFHFPEGADCQLTSVEADTDMAADQHEEHDHEHQEGHTDFQAHYRFTCGSPAALSHLDVKLFERFPHTEKLNVQLITTRRQGAAVLTADSPRLDF